jgi:hypothetical protein
MAASIYGPLRGLSRVIAKRPAAGPIDGCRESRTHFSVVKKQLPAFSSRGQKLITRVAGRWISDLRNISEAFGKFSRESIYLIAFGIASSFREGRSGLNRDTVMEIGVVGIHP